MILELTWAELKTILNIKPIPFLYFDKDSNYFIYAGDGPIAYSCVIPKEDTPSSVQTDFENNYKDSGNLLPKLYGDSVLLDPITKNTTTVFYLKMDLPCWPQGTIAQIIDADFGDYINIKITDKDNTLSLGSDYVLAEIVKKWYVPSAPGGDGKIYAHIPTIPGKVLYPNLYLKISYTSVSSILEPTPQGFINFSFYR